MKSFFIENFKGSIMIIRCFIFTVLTFFALPLKLQSEITVDCSITKSHFDDILLVIHYNHAYWNTIPFLKDLYSDFPNIVFYGDIPHPALASIAKPYEKEVIQIANHEGWYFTRVMEDALIRYPNYRGYIFMQDDVMMNYWNFSRLNKDKIWFAVSFRLPDACSPPWNVDPPSWDINFDKSRSREELYHPWHARWWSFENGIHLVNNLMPNIPHKNQAILKRNLGDNEGAGMVCDMFYIPQGIRKDAIYLSRLFKDVFCETAVPMMLASLDVFENWEILRCLWSYNAVPFVDPSVEPDYVSKADWLHPLKFSKETIQKHAQKRKKTYTCEEVR